MEETISAWFAATVARHRHCLALVDGDEELTYGDLARRATAVADALVDLDVQPGEPVAILADQGASAVAMVLGILEAGAVFAPVSLLEPPARARELLALVGARTLVASEATLERASRIVETSTETVRVVNCDRLQPSDPSRPRRGAVPDSPASIFFTSGSTGAPKAVLDTHRNVLHNVLRYTNLLQVAPADRLSLVQPPSFSGMASSLFTALANGATLCTFSLTPERLPLLATWTAAQRVTVFHSVPAVFRVLVAGGRVFDGVRLVRLEGDRASWHDVELFRRSFPADAVLANGLGTTETGLACQFRVDSGIPLGTGVLPVGTAAPGMEVVVLDRTGKPAPPGETGEIAVRSKFLARGYVGSPLLTERRFLPGDGDARTYLTGDLGRIGHDGLVECLGRLDGAEKIAGIRVEPAEVEAALLAVDGVAEALVTVKSTPRGGGQLVATVVASRPGLTAGAVRAALGERLPVHMIPPRIEVATSGRVDPNWKAERRERAPARPLTPFERELQAVWEDVLRTEVGITDTFASLGGDSLAAAEIASVVELRLGLDVPASLLARAATVERLAAALETRQPDRSVALVVLRDGDAGIPLLLIPDHTGRALMYATVARHVPGDRPVWSLQLAPARDEQPLPAIAQETVDVLRAAQPEGPYLLGGFCYGALVALEAARILVDAGDDAHPILLGLTPTDVPDLVSADALKRWEDVAGGDRMSVARLRYHLRVARRRSLPAALTYLAGRARTTAGLTVRALRGHRRGGAPRGALAHRAEPFHGRATLVLAAEVAAAYADDPAKAWQGLAGTVEVCLVNGVDVDHELLGARGAARLGAALAGTL